jgi:hypothetical protein
MVAERRRPTTRLSPSAQGSVLERAHLVRRRKVGREHLLSFNPEPLDEAAAWIETQRALWTARLNALDALLQAEDRAASTTLPERKDGPE